MKRIKSGNCPQMPNMREIVITLLILVCVIVAIGAIKLYAMETSAEEIAESDTSTVGFTANDFLKTEGTKIVNQNGKEIVLRGYNLGLWLSRSFWGLPISMQYNSFDTERYSPVNSIEIDYELFSNSNLTKEQVAELNNLFYSNQITEEDIQIIAETGANLVRVPVEWTFFMRPEYDENYSGDIINKADYNNYGALSYVDTTLENASDKDKEFLNKRLEYLEWIVKECGERKIYVIFDLHIAPGGLNTGGFREAPLFFEKGEAGEARRACVLRIWNLIADKFKNNPTIAGYDIINEPSCFNQGQSEKYINVIDFYDEVYKMIRDIEKDCENNHIIIMEGKVKSYSNSNVEISDTPDDMGLPIPSEYGWENVMYSKHEYFNNFRNAEEDEGMDEEWQNDNPNIETMKARMKKSTEDTVYFEGYYNVPIWIGEFSCHAYYNDNEGNVVGTFQDSEGNRFTLNKEYTEYIWNYQIQLYEKNNISYTAWTYKACWENYFGLVYYGRQNGINRVNLKAATYEEIAEIFGGNSPDIMNYNKNFHNIFKKQLQIFKGVDISANGDGSIIATLSNDKTTLIITGTGKMADFSSVEIEACETYQFDIKTVPPWYEYRENITTVEISDNITNIGQDAFLNCANLQNITIPNTVKTIGAYAFHNCKGIASIKISNSVTNINMGAFYKCEGLKWIELGNGVSYIGKETFSGCSNLNNIYVFASNLNYAAVDGVLYNKEKTKIIKYPEGKENAEYIIPSTVTSIEDNAFSRTTLTSIIIPKDVIEIGSDVFSGSNDVTIICKSGTAIETYAIENEIPYVLDKGFPQITFTPNGGTETVKSEIIKITLEDLGTGTITGIDYTNLKYYWGERSEGVSKSEIITQIPEGETIETPTQQGTYYLWILARDKVGNEKIARSEGFSIDAVAPTVTIENSGGGIVTIKSNEEIQEVDGWELAEDKLKLTKIYTEHKEETVIIKDLLGNETEVKITVEHDIQAPTCTENGKCKLDGCTYTIEALDHTEVIDEAVAATCETAGKTEGKHCSVCNKVLVAQTTIPALGHNYESGVCTRCGEKEPNVEVTSEKYEVEETNISKIQPKTTLQDLRENLSTNAEEIKVYTKDKEEVSETEILGTGAQIELKLGDETRTFTLVIKGDINGDGEVKVSDMTIINRYRLHKRTLEGEYLLAGDVTGDGVVDIKDLVKINRYRLHKIEEL
ncbi:MAG: leucine-rich repeat protein [Clostridia bacterium]